MILNGPALRKVAALKFDVEYARLHGRVRESGSKGYMKKALRVIYQKSQSIPIIRRFARTLRILSHLPWVMDQMSERDQRIANLEVRIRALQKAMDEK